MSFKNVANPTSLPCFRMCSACWRCEDKGLHDKCKSCSGRHDPGLTRDPYHVDDRCRCSQGIFQYRLQNGRLLQRPYPHDPYKGKITYQGKSQDEKDWDAYVQEQRERLDDPDFYPIQINNGKSPS